MNRNLSHLATAFTAPVHQLELLASVGWYLIGITPSVAGGLLRWHGVIARVDSLEKMPLAGADPGCVLAELVRFAIADVGGVTAETLSDEQIQTLLEVGDEETIADGLAALDATKPGRPSARHRAALVFNRRLLAARGGLS